MSSRKKKQGALPIAKQHLEISTMAEAQMRADMVALMQTEQALLCTRQQVAAAPRAAAPLVDTRTIGKAPPFTGEHRDWIEWSFQFTEHTWHPRIQVDRSTLGCEGGKQDHSCSSENTELRGSQPS